MGKDRAPGKSGASPAATPASAVPTSGKRTLVDDEDVAAGDQSGVVAASGSVFGLHIPLVTQAKQPDLKVHPPEDMGQAIAHFRLALDKGDADGAQLAWSFASPKAKHEFGQSSTINRDLTQIVHVMGPYLVPIMADAGLDFAGRGELIDLMLKVGFPHWFDPIADHARLFSTFMDNLPPRDALDNKGIAKLDRLIRGMSTARVLKPLFERIYVPLSDTTYNANKVRTAPWQVEQIHRLYDVLSTHLPIAHVRTVRSFHLGTEEKKGGDWKKLKYAWWDSAGYVVLPEKEADDGGGRDHRMTGGGLAHADPKTERGKTQGAMDKFDVGALHEVGHAVGGSLGGHDWAEKHPFVGWQTKMTLDAWSKGLWGNDAALTARASRRADGGRAISSQSARNYLAQDLLGNGTLPPGWTDNDAYARAILKQYGDQPLAKYWQKCKAHDDEPDWYKFSGTENYGSDGRVYVYLSRGHNKYSSYTQQAHKQMVSWYSLSSPHEWFAEQYAHYYRTGKTGEGLESGTAKKLAELDTQQPAQAPAAPAGTGPSEEYDGDATEHRLPFPW